MPDHTTTLGNVELISLSDGSPMRSPLAPFPDTTIEQWREFPGLLDSNDQYMTRYGTVAVRSEGKLIVVDTGLQDADGTLMDDMKAKRIDPAAVDLVVFTHLHPDHVGWNLTDGRPNFPNARYLAPRKDWDYWTQPEVAGAPHITNQVLPLQELNLIDQMDDGHKITGELTTVPTPGHTPGHISINIASSGERGYILGDVAHNLAQAHYTGLVPHLRHRARRFTQDTPSGAGHAGSGGHHGLRRPFPPSRFRALRPRRIPQGLAGHLDQMITSVATYHLEMTDPSALRPKPNQIEGLTFNQVLQPTPEFNRFLYTAVGGDWYWIDRLPWTYRQWQDLVGRPEFQTWVAYVSGSPAGYVELESQSGGDVEIVSFGLLPSYIGRGLGGHFLTVAIEKAWQTGASRVWLHTCSLDHPNALANYRARGLQVFREETASEEIPDRTPGPWPGAHPS